MIFSFAAAQTVLVHGLHITVEASLDTVGVAAFCGAGKAQLDLEDCRNKFFH